MKAREFLGEAELWVTRHSAPFLSSSARTALSTLRPVKWQKGQCWNDAWGRVGQCPHLCGKAKASEGKGLPRGLGARNQMQPRLLHFSIVSSGKMANWGPGKGGDTGSFSKWKPVKRMRTVCRKRVSNQSVRSERHGPDQRARSLESVGRHPRDGLEVRGLLGPTAKTSRQLVSVP